MRNYSEQPDWPDILAKLTVNTIVGALLAALAGFLWARALSGSVTLGVSVGVGFFISVSLITLLTVASRGGTGTSRAHPHVMGMMCFPMLILTSILALAVWLARLVLGS